ncbi:hypothetical protein [Aquabacterium sp. NJ1]|uniref:hypothetical protein n=1 Tax=Aquabacterium sp. NJ1 TaxID=1538295 RepID=UPI00126A617B|nr:hypothetical protein [Aquabacterium sp. NJ1]
MTDTFTNSQKSEPFLLGNAVGCAVMVLLFTYVIDSPLRFGLSKLHISPVIYLRDAGALAITLAAFWHWIKGKQLNASTFVGFVILIHVFYGILALGSLVQPIVGFKLYLTMLLGVASYETYSRHPKATAYWAAIAFVVTAVGVGINWFVDMPWTGEVFDSARGDTAVSVEWTTGGIRRLSGFARASYDASTIAAVTCIPLLFLPSTGIIKRFALIITATGIIILTTSKGSLLAMIFIAFFALFFTDIKKQNKISWPFFLLPAVSLGIPAILSAYGFKAELTGNLWVLFSSFGERINWMWPRAFANITTGGNYLLGRGVGGIGFPQYFGEGSIYNAADNTMVYLFANFGLFALIYIYLILIRLKRNAQNISSYAWHCILAWLIYWNIYGLTTNIIENPFFTFFLGLIIGAAFTKRSDNLHAPAAS